MSAGWITCPLCGQQFDAEAHRSCQACPLKSGCSMLCCPYCGYKVVDPGHSVLARLVSKWLPAKELPRESVIQADERGSKV